MKEKARNIIQKLRKNFPKITELCEREKKLNHIAQINIKGNAIFATSKLKPIAHSKDAVIQVPTLDQRITANAEDNDRTQVPTNASTSTETTLELSNIVVGYDNLSIPNAGGLLEVKVSISDKKVNIVYPKDNSYIKKIRKSFVLW